MQRLGKKNMSAKTTEYEERFPRIGGRGEAESRIKRKESQRDHKGCGDFYGHLCDIQTTLAYERGTHAVV